MVGEQQSGPLRQTLHWAGRLGTEIMSEQATSLYLHVPFCRRRCRYCDFYSQVCSAKGLALWKSGVLQEIEALSGVARPLETVYVGGGTPSVVSGTDLTAILDRLQAVFGLAAGAEITVEANPESVTATWLQALHRQGVNRLSLGLQSVSPLLLRRLGRQHTALDFERAVETARAIGYSNISCDLMLGVPGERLQDVQDSLAFVLQTGVEHVSFYSLQLEEGTPLHQEYGGQEVDEAAEEEERAAYWWLREALGEAGFQVYEISNAGRPGFFARHNLVYWQGRSYYGLGPAAASFIWDERRSNPASLSAWSAAVRENPGQPLAASRLEERVDRHTAMQEALLLGLRLTAGVSEADFRERFGVSLVTRFQAEIQELLAAGLLARENGRLFLSRRGIDFANQVFLHFV